MQLISTILPLAAITTAMVFLDQQVMQQTAFEKQPQSYLDKIKASVEEIWSGIEESSKNFAALGKNGLDNAFDAATDAGKKAAARFECHHSMMAFDAQGWLDSAFESVEVHDIHDTSDDPHEEPKHPKHPPPGHDPHHKSDQTVYQLIAGSKYTTRLAQLINRYPDLVELLNGTAANYTVFAPIDKAFDKIPEHAKEPSKEAIYKMLTYHVSPVHALGGYEQRLRVGFGLGGLHLNFYSKIIATNIFGTNGVIHGIDTLILPPPPASKIIELVSSEFSTLELALLKTGLDKVLAEPHTGGTLFAPSNAAFAKLGPKVNAFLFSKYGEKYLKALVEYHIVANRTMYSDAYFFGDKDSHAENIDEADEGGPKGTFHVDLPTLLHKRSLSIDIARWGRLISIKINGFTTVRVPDGIAKDGVVHVLSNVLIPSKIPGGAEWTGVEMSVDEFKDRFDDYIGKLEL